MSPDNKKRSNILKKGGILLLSGIVATGILLDPAGIYRRSDSSYAVNEVASETEEQVNKAFPKISRSSSGNKLTKDETVYVIMDSDGNENETVVSEWLKNPEELDQINDETTLTDIENTNGDEKFSQDGNDLVWDAKGNDIKYTGKTDESMPVSMEISYYLNGEEVSASEIAGQSGDIEIHFDYFVNSHDRVTSNGKGYEITHPYVLASGVMFDKDHFTDIEVNNGKVVSEGESTICLGIALPGLKESLSLEKDTLDIPESVVIKATTDKFAIDGTYTIAMTGLLDDLDISTGDATDKIDELEDAFGKLSDASSELVKGSGKLAKGTDALTDGTSKLKKGTSTLKKGTTNLKTGTSKLSDGTSKLKKKSGTLATGIKKLYGGSKMLSTGTTELKQGTGQAVEGAKALNDGLSQLSGNSEAINAGTAQIEATVFESATAQLQATLIQGGMPAEQASAFKLTPSTYSQVLEKLKQAVPDHKDAFDATKASLDGVEQYVAGVKAYTEGVDKSAAGSGEFYTKLQALDQGADKVDKGASDMNKGLSTLSDNIPALKKGIKQLDDGASELDSGAGELNKGVSTLKKGAKALDKGAGTLDKGMDTLALGVKKFDKEGIKKLVSSFDTDKLDDMLGRFDAVAKASKKSSFVGGAPEKMKGESKIIFKTAKI